jgi:hypothetical protein
MQIKLYLQGQGIYSFVDDSFPNPLSHIVSIYMVAPTINPSFLLWKQQDHLIMSAFLPLVFLMKSCTLFLIVNIL